MILEFQLISVEDCLHRNFRVTRKSTINDLQLFAPIKPDELATQFTFGLFWSHGVQMVFTKRKIWGKGS